MTEAFEGSLDAEIQRLQKRIRRLEDEQDASRERLAQLVEARGPSRELSAEAFEHEPRVDSSSAGRRLRADLPRGCPDARHPVGDALLNHGTSECSALDCEEPVLARGLCSAHYAVGGGSLDSASPSNPYCSEALE